MLKANSKTAKPSRQKSRASSTLAKAQAKAKARHQRLLEHAKQNRPPQSWFEQTDCPFVPTKG